MKVKTLAVCFSAFFIFISAIFAEEEKSIFTYHPKQKVNTENSERKLQQEINNIKSSGFYSDLLKYKAVRDDNPDLCPDSSCQNEVRETLLPIRYMAEKRCEEIKGNTFKKEICSAIIKEDCNSLDEPWKKDYCRNFLEGKVVELESIAIAKKLEKPKYAKTFILYDLGIYSGFKYYSPLACERYISQISTGDRALTLADKLCCQILFSSDADRIMEDILKDLAYFNLSRKENNMSHCNNIKNPRIKQVCFNPKTEKLENAWEQSY